MARAQRGVVWAALLLLLAGRTATLPRRLAIRTWLDRHRLGWSGILDGFVPGAH